MGKDWKGWYRSRSLARSGTSSQRSKSWRRHLFKPQVGSFNISITLSLLAFREGSSCFKWAIGTICHSQYQCSYERSAKRGAKFSYIIEKYENEQPISSANLLKSLYLQNFYQKVTLLKCLYLQNSIVARPSLCVGPFNIWVQQDWTHFGVRQHLPLEGWAGWCHMFKWPSLSISCRSKDVSHLMRHMFLCWLIFQWVFVTWPAP